MRHLVFGELAERREHFHCAVTRLRPRQATFLHDHDFPEMFVVREGKGWNEVNGVPHALAGGLLVWVDAADRHCLAAAADRPLEIVNLALAPKWWRSFRRLFSPRLDPGAPGKPRSARLDADNLGRIAFTWLQLLSPGADADWLLLQGVKSALEALSAGAAAPAAPPEWLEALRGMMRDPALLAHPISWWQRQSGFSKEHLARSCRRHYGRTLTALLNEARIAWVRRELLTGQKTVTALALEAGFGHQGHFHETFKALSGTTPDRWRRLAANATLPRR